MLPLPRGCLHQVFPAGSVLGGGQKSGRYGPAAAPGWGPVERVSGAGCGGHGSGTERMNVRHGLPPAGGLEQQQLRIRPEGPPISLSRAGSVVYSGGVRQQDFSAGGWLRRKDRLEHVSPSRTSALSAVEFCALPSLLHRLNLELIWSSPGLYWVLPGFY